MTKHLTVIDAGVAVHTVVTTELSEASEHALRILRTQNVEVCAPRLWLYEVTSAIHKIFMLGEINEEEAQKALENAFGLGIQLLNTNDLCQKAFNWATRMKRLGAYDCFYMAQAEKMESELWTADKKLANTANQLGAEWVRWVGDI